MKKTLSTLALSLFAFAGIAQAADITVENAAGKQVVHKIHSVSLCLILGRQIRFVH